MRAVSEESLLEMPSALTFQFTSRLEMELNYPKPKEISILDGLWSDDSSLTLATKSS
ncbi:hypothetical protein PFC_05815 [Pyrococcus furiosus COM1]|uniref:Uncharacterized protein n=1 Tax=Pyrococcus furiosus COM1 TaxID=1185654 RepID=I6UZJ9_9EURY|nr:hypothetical protein PFC_05815 [Pyrococcus furiosus COM1]